MFQKQTRLYYLVQFLNLGHHFLGLLHAGLNLVLKFGVVAVLQTMPAIKTLTSQSDLFFENAEMAIAGSYVYDDDGVFNPDNITD